MNGAWSWAEIYFPGFWLESFEGIIYGYLSSLSSEVCPSSNLLTRLLKSINKSHVTRFTVELCELNLENMSLGKWTAPISNTDFTYNSSDVQHFYVTTFESC
jgi:hypothetical protein